MSDKAALMQTPGLAAASVDISSGPPGSLPPVSTGDTAATTVTCSTSIPPTRCEGAVEVWLGDTRAILPTLPSEAVDCVVTSPPYFGLRDYGTGYWEGGIETCSHAAAKRKTRYDYSLARSPLQQKRGVGTDARPGLFKERCPTCGARRIDDQLGLEASSELFSDALADLFEDVRRVLRRRGVLFLNLGDSHDDGNLLGVPWKVAFKLQERGWILRQCVIWSKPNPMPESAKTRPTTAHEYVFILVKDRDYFWNYDAVKEPAAWDRWGDQTAGKYEGFDGKASMIQPRTKEELEANEWRNCRSVWEIPTQPVPYAHFATMPEALAEKCVKAGCPQDGLVFDPFLGAGTTALVARDLGRRAWGIELNPENVEITFKRLGTWTPRRTERSQLALWSA